MTTATITPEVVLEKLVALFHELNTINADIKAFVDEAKEAGIENTSAIKAAAKLKADSKEADWVEKTNAIRSLIEGSSEE